MAGFAWCWLPPGFQQLDLLIYPLLLGTLAYTWGTALGWPAPRLVSLANAVRVATILLVLTGLPVLWQTYQARPTPLLPLLAVMDVAVLAILLLNVGGDNRPPDGVDGDDRLPISR